MFSSNVKSWAKLYNFRKIGVVSLRILKNRFPVLLLITLLLFFVKINIDLSSFSIDVYAGKLSHKYMS